MQRDADAPAVRRGPDEQRAKRGHRDYPERTMGPEQAKVHEDDARRDRQPIADHRERPRVAGIALVYEAAGRASVDVMAPA